MIAAAREERLRESGQEAVRRVVGSDARHFERCARCRRRNSGLTELMIVLYTRRWLCPRLLGKRMRAFRAEVARVRERRLRSGGECAESFSFAVC